LTPLFWGDTLRNGGVLLCQDKQEKEAAVGYIILC
jgi:hypothetical protein